MRLVRLALFSVLAISLVPALALADALNLEVTRADVGEHIGQHAVYIELTRQSAVDYARFTKKNIGNIVVFRVGGNSIQRPKIVSMIANGDVILITKSVNEAVFLAEQLNSGKTSLEVEEEQKP
jgi:preprotein translocase subunit SecD